MQVETLNKIADKAKTKKDGVFSLQGHAYRVRNGRVTHVVDGYRVIIPYGHFVVEAGEFYTNSEAVKALKAMA